MTRISVNPKFLGIFCERCFASYRSHKMRCSRCMCVDSELKSPAMLLYVSHRRDCLSLASDGRVANCDPEGYGL